MRFIVLLFMFCWLMFGADEKLDNISSCKTCHREQVKLWEKSWHSQNNAELYSAVVDIVAKENKLLRAEVLKECSVCHNPTLSLSTLDHNYMYSKALNLHSQIASDIDKKINIKNLSGINCFACHRIDSIKIPRSDQEVGIHAVKFFEDTNTFAGPYSDAVEQAHSNVYKDFFNSKDDLCITCHNGIPVKNKNSEPNYVSAYTTGDEIMDTNKKCIDCHMGELFPTIGTGGKVRLGRPHIFAGAHDIRQVRSAIRLIFDKETNILKVINTAPHMTPTGFGGRLLQIHIFYEDANGEIIYQEDNKTIFQETLDIGSKYEKNGKPTVQYLADVLAYNNALAPNDTREWQLTPPKKAKAISVQIFFYYMNPDLTQEYNLQYLSQQAIGPVEIFYDEDIEIEDEDYSTLNVSIPKRRIFKLK